MFRNTVLLVCGVFLSLVLSCKKEKVPCTGCGTTGTTNCEDIQNVKKFFAFKVGSWWLYEEENSGMRDSVYVTQYANNPENAAFDIRLFSTHYGFFYHYWVASSSTSSECSDSGIICHRCIKIKRSKYKPGDYVGEATCFLFLPIIDSKDYNFNAYFENNYVYVKEDLDTFQANGISYGRTIRMYETNTITEGYQPTNHYYSENVGLVRKELLDSNQVWNLIDYHIQK